MGKRDSKKLVEEITSKVEDKDVNASNNLDSSDDEKNILEKMEDINEELTSLDEASQKRIKNLEFEAERYLWFPDVDSTERVRCRCCINKNFHSMKSAVAHLQTHYHKHQVRKFVIANCKNENKIAERKQEQKERKERWLEKKKEKKAEKKNISEEEIEKRKKSFQDKKARRLSRKENKKTSS